MTQFKGLWPIDVCQVRAPGINFYVIRDKKGLVLIDARFIGGRWLLRKALHGCGWEKVPVIGIIITHGHLDHILNVGKLAHETGAWIAAPRLDLLHYQGIPNYSGWSRVTGSLESVGRPLLRFRPFTPDRLFDDGDLLEVWDGLRVIHLPGHTAGHSGSYCESRKLLFSADLFASYAGFAHLPPQILNIDSREIPKSLTKALSLDLTGVLPNHGDHASPEIHLSRLRRLQDQLMHTTRP